MRRGGQGRHGEFAGYQLRFEGDVRVVVKMSDGDGVDDGGATGALANEHLGTRQAGRGGRASDGRQVLNLSTWQVEVARGGGAVHPGGRGEPLGVVAERGDVVDGAGAGDGGGERVGAGVQGEAVAQGGGEVGRGVEAVRERLAKRGLRVARVEAVPGGRGGGDVRMQDGGATETMVAHGLGVGERGGVVGVGRGG